MQARELVGAGVKIIDLAAVPVQGYGAIRALGQDAARLP
jgi:hypothetical protein